MNSITLLTMKPLNIFAYLLAVLFIILLIRATILVVKKNNREKKLLKIHEEYTRNEKKLRNQGLKKFTFDQGKTIVWSTDFKKATAQYQASRKNGK